MEVLVKGYIRSKGVIHGVKIKKFLKLDIYLVNILIEIHIYRQL